nr:hypothetical protein [Tanacetum cinerariifolium]
MDNYIDENCGLLYNDFPLGDASEVEEYEDLNATICMMSRIQQTRNDFGNDPNYDSEFISDVSNPSISFINPLYSQKKMVDESVPTPSPIRFDDQILPFVAWVPLEKATSLGHSLPQPREALEITPIDQAHQFVSPPSGDAIIDFVNELGYTEAQIHTSPFHLVEEDLRLGNLKFVPKGEDYEVFGMPIPNKLISNNIRNIPYYNAYLEMVAKHDRKVTAKKGGKKKPATAKQFKSEPVKEKSSKPAPAPKPKGT